MRGLAVEPGPENPPPPAIAPRDDSVRSISRAAVLLREIAAAPVGVTVAVLATRTGLPRSTVYRLVGALREAGFLHVARDGRLGIGYDLKAMAARAMPRSEHPLAWHAERVASELEETVVVAVLDVNRARLVYEATSSQTLCVRAPVGDGLPLHATAGGKTLLATLAAADVRKLLPSTLEVFTRNTITDRERLFAEIDEIRLSGLAFNREERSEGICAVGTAAEGPSGRAAALVVVVPSARFDAVAPDAAEVLRAVSSVG